MSDIAAGKGRGPKPFMLDTRKIARADAIWNSKESESAPKRASKKRVARRLPHAEFIEPELCKLVEHPPRGQGWGHEVKLDGYRMQLRVAAQARRLSDAQGSRLDRQVRSDRRARAKSLDLHHRRRGRRTR